VDATAEEPLAGGLAHPGEVVRVGDTVRRPAGTHTEAVFALLGFLAEIGFDGTPRPLGLDELEREVWAFVPGDVPIPPFPAWSMTDGALASVARLLRRYHDAAAGFDGSRFTWSDEMADPRGGTAICHTDICPENVVFRDGEAVALLDFDFASPGRALWDVVATTGMWAPLRPLPQRTAAMEALDAVTRVRVFVDAYGLGAEDRGRFLEVLRERRSLRFLERRVEAGEPQFVEIWDAIGGAEGRAAEDEAFAAWLESNRSALHAALGI
jgi:hypothetical protein